VILLLRPGTEAPAELREALRRNNSEPVVVDHALAAMGHLCDGRAAVLLLCEPDKLAGTRELLGAVERYTPRVTRWEYIPGQSPPLRPIAAHPARPESARSESAPSEPARSMGGEARPSDPFALRLTHEPVTDRAERPATPADLLTRDELEALFSEDSP